MSRIGRLPIDIPAGVEVKIEEGNKVTVKGPKGTLEKCLPVEMTIKQEDNQVVVTRPNDLKKMKSLHGLTRSLIANMITGVSEGYEKKLEINGVGYRAQKKGKEGNKGGFRDRNGGKNGGRGNFQKGRYGDGPRPLKRSDNPDVIYGRDFDDDAITIDSIAGEMGEITIRGQVTSVEAREIRNEKTIYMFNVTDFTDTITVKMFLHNEQVPEISGAIKKGAFLKLKGVTTIDKFDHEITIGSLAGIRKISDFTTSRMDNSPEKRVELHCHTKMSDMDGVTDASVLVKRAYKWGHPAIAITDHGVVQSFPEANHAYDDIVSDYRKQYQKDHPEATKDEMKQVYPPFKVIYGVEAYLVDDLRDIVINEKGQTLMGETYVVFDIETTGFSPVKNRIIEIGAVKVVEGKIVDRFSTFVNPRVPIPFRI